MQTISDHGGEAHGGGDDAEAWDRRYESRERRWSGDPNGALAAEVAGLAPGAALDVGCGEGGDAIWLAQQGWEVTGVDISAVALDRARRAAREAGVRIEWSQADVAAEPPAQGRYDLVSGQYLAIPNAAGDATLEALIGAVATGGLLLVVGHAHDADEPDGGRHGFDPAAYLQPEDFAERLGDGWTIETHETRARPQPPGTGPSSRHTHDVVLRARRG